MCRTLGQIGGEVSHDLLLRHLDDSFPGRGHLTLQHQELPDGDAGERAAKRQQPLFAPNS